MSNTENNTNTENTRKTREGIPLGNRFASLPVFGEDNAPKVDRTDVLTLTEVAELAGRTKLTATKYLRNASQPVDAICLVPTGSVGRPAPAYPRVLVEQALGEAASATRKRASAVQVARNAADADLAAAAEVAGSFE